MMRRMIVALLLIGATFSAVADDELDAFFPKDVLIITASADACYRFDVYLAINPTQRSRGLMFVRNLPQMTGMLFIYEGSELLYEQSDVHQGAATSAPSFREGQANPSLPGHGLPQKLVGGAFPLELPDAVVRNLAL